MTGIHKRIIKKRKMDLQLPNKNSDWNINNLDLKTKKLMITLKSLNRETYNILPTISADPATNIKKQQH